MYKLYSLAGTCSTGITVLLEKLGVKYQVIQRDDVENYSQIVPTNQVPALVVDNQVITEGAAIALYLLEKHQNDMMPTAVTDKAEFLRWLPLRADKPQHFNLWAYELQPSLYPSFIAFLF